MVQKLTQSSDNSAYAKLKHPLKKTQASHHQNPSRKLKKIKQSSISRKLKASRAYLKSLFSKSGCSDEFCAKAACNVEAGNVSKNKDCVNNIDKELAEDAANSHRRSFSGVIQKHSTAKSSSTSISSSNSSSSSSFFSFSSSGFYDLQFLKRITSTNLEIENSIEGAIAHCKQSLQLSGSRKTATKLGLC
ncbi:putative membrane-associated kinase regulator 3 [Hibiscus syriacus]|uniref:Membrane-associated kinase regulator 3 n=1 Tax=Hibiscus syriacus TaxID=106335 RepID=A0A6A3AQB3_HIBSY|nr:putative membrane-associated kinase regulator 3 [Hibiscus syriacus]